MLKILKTLVLAMLAGGWLTSCQTPPTATYESQTGRFQVGVRDYDKPIQITDKTILIDTRSAFEYQMAHVSGSINLMWTDFTLFDKEKIGQLRPDLFELTRRLAYMGIAPDSELVLITRTNDGDPDGGRLAWTLFYFGVSNIKMVGANYFRTKWTQSAPPPRKSVPIWKPKLVDSVMVGLDDFKTAIKAPPGSVILLDVRRQNEYLHRDPEQEPNVQAINVEWREFFNERGIPNKDIIPRLREAGITEEKRIIVYCDSGVRSAAATMALLQLGFTKAGNFAGGLRQYLQ